jgi:hypothetical protein
MPARLESQIERTVVNAARKDGWTVLKLVALGHRGFPDRWFIKEPVDHCGHPQIVLIEFKAPGRRSRKLQVYVNAMMRGLGFEVHENVDTVAEGKEILDL